MAEEIMRTIDAREAETCFFRLLDDVTAGKEIAITWDGEPVAILIPAKLGLQKGNMRQVIEEIRTTRQDHSLRLSIEELVNEGRKY